VAEKFLVKKTNPAAVNLFGFRRGVGYGDGGGADHMTTIEQGTGSRE